MNFRNIFRFREHAAGRSDQNDATKPFLEHLEDLRWMLIKMAILLAVAMVACFFFREELMAFIQRPLHSVPGDPGHGLKSLNPADSFTISFTLAFYGGLIIAFPFLLYFFAQFVLPALTQREKKYIYPAVAVGFGLFMTGVSLAFFFLLPMTLKFLAADAAKMRITADWTIREYSSFVTQFTLGLGLAFELPVVVLVLVKIGLLSYATLSRTRSYALIIILFLAAIIAPTPDLFTWVMMSAPLLILYESCIWIAWYIERQEKKRELAEAEERSKAEHERLARERALRAPAAPVEHPPGGASR
jgi:sec-independent protein translocase protein TatC